jgi:hypothetical protein
MKAKLYLGLFLMVISNQTLKAQWSRNATTGTVSLTTASDIVKLGNDVGAGTFFTNSFKLRANGAVGAVSYWDLDDEDFFLDPTGISQLSDVRASIFRDRDNISYYVDPANSSVLNNLSANSLNISSSASFTTANFTTASFTNATINGSLNGPDEIHMDYGTIYIGPMLSSSEGAKIHASSSGAYDGNPYLSLAPPGTEYDPAGHLYLQGGGSAEGAGGNVLIEGGVGAPIGSIYLTPFYNTNVGIGFSATTTLQAKLDVNGSVRASSYITVSDGTLKEGTKTFNSGLEKILSLRGVQYKFKEINGLTLPKGPQTGFIAQEVEQVLPDAVVTDGNGLKGVDYNKIIPVLVEAIKEQQGQIEVLKRKLSEVKPLPSTMELSSGNKLHQNFPNPTSKGTLIKYELTDEVVNSSIMIYDLQGKQLKRIPLNKNADSIEIQANELPPGIYLYSLVANGKEIDTKRMVITD